MTAITYLLDHAGDIAIALSILAGVIFPALSRIAKLFGDGPKAVAVSKFFDGLGVDLGKAGRAIKAFRAPTIDELARDLNAPPESEEDTEVRRREGGGK